jgi:hypothetical protein
LRKLLLLFLVFCSISFSACTAPPAPPASSPTPEQTPTPQLSQTKTPNATPATPPLSPPTTPTPLVLRVGGSSGNFKSIQEAINVAQPGSTIQVAQGTYFENITINSSKDISLQGGWNSDFSSRSNDEESTIIDGSARSSVISVNATNNFIVSLKVDGFSIRNGKADEGGGIFVRADRSAVARIVVRHCKINGNQATRNGGGVVLGSLGGSTIDASFEYDVISNNSAVYVGGGITGSSTNDRSLLRWTVASSNISGNTVSGLSKAEGGLGIDWGGGWDGGGVAVFAMNGGMNEVLLQNNYITNNKSGYGGGILVNALGKDASIKGTLFNNVIARNVAVSGGGGGEYIMSEPSNSTGSFVGSVIWSQTNNTIVQNVSSRSAAGIVCASSGTGGSISLLLRNDIVWGNTDPNGGNSLTPQIAVGHPQPPPGPVTTQTASVMYSDVGDFITAGTGQYTPNQTISIDPLLSNSDGILTLKASSPCIDAGDPNSDMNDGQRPPGKGTERNDMGAYGGPKNNDWPIQ